MKLFKNKVKGFTLVELIVVITILAILGTIAFINLQGYSAEARDGKRLSDINNVFKKISVERIKGVSPSNIMKEGIDIKTGLTIRGLPPTEGKQGKVDFLTIKEEENRFKDPKGNDYIYSYGIGGTGSGVYKFVQLATLNESNNKAVVVGDYYKIETNDSPSIILSDANDLNSPFVVNDGSDLPYSIDNNLNTQSVIDVIDFETESGYIITQAPWNRTTIEKSEGSYSLESGNQTDDSISCFEVTTNQISSFNVKFDYKVSSEGGYDFLSFYKNNILQSQWSGEEPWNTYVSTLYSSGNNIFKWCYEKDSSELAGQDKTWIDKIIIEKNIVLINGVCSSENGKDKWIIPTNLCFSGIPTNVIDNGVGSTYTWTCGGINGGTSPSCSANHINNPVVHYRAIDGLMDNGVRGVTTDTSGNIWSISPGFGASKYNGTSFTTYTTADGLIDNWTLSVYADNIGNVWFGTNSGLSKFDGITWTNYTTANGLAGNSIRDITQDISGNMWFSTNGSISKFDGTTWTTYTKANGVSWIPVGSIYADTLGNIWFTSSMSGGGIFKFNGTTWTIYTTADGLVSNYIGGIGEDSLGNMWFGSDGNGVIKFDGTTFTTYTTADGLADDSVYNVYGDNLGNMRIATYRGLSKYDGTNFTTIRTGYSYEITQDLLGKIWFGALEVIVGEGGLLHYNN